MNIPIYVIQSVHACTQTGERGGKSKSVCVMTRNSTSLAYFNKSYVLEPKKHRHEHQHRKVRHGHSCSWKLGHGMMGIQQLINK